MQINVSFDQSTRVAPEFVTAVNWVVNYFDNLFTNNVTLNIDVGYGEVGGYSLGGALGASIGNYVSASYTSIKNALVAQNAPGASTLPATSPVPGALYMPVAEAHALGLSSHTALDGWVGFSDRVNWSFTPNVTPPSGAYDFIGTFEHELTEIMGRVSLIDYQPNFYAVADLYRYTATGAHSLTTGGTGSLAYFSVDGGHTLLASWNNNPANGDLGDWYGQPGNDMANDYASPGVINALSAVDLTEMQALGWTTTSAPASPGTRAGPVVDTTPPVAPTIASFSTDSGKVGDGITNDNTLTLTGAAEANSTVKIYDGATLLGGTAATASGTWSFTTATLIDGTQHHLTATATDAAGNVSVPSTALNVTIDTVAPNAPVIASDTVVNINEIMLSGTSEANATIKVYDGTTLVGSSLASAAGAWTYTTAALSDGTHTLVTKATDVADNTSVASQSVTLTIATRGPPTTTIDSRGTTTTDPDPSTLRSFSNAGQADTFVFSKDNVKDLGTDPHLLANVDHNDRNTLDHLADELADAARVQSVTSLPDLADLLGSHNNTPSDHSDFHV